MESCRVRYLEQEEKQAVRSLYAAAFPEDSREFIEYYFTWKTRDNEILVMEGAGGDSSFHVMVHLNPYQLRICRADRVVPYIVAVATDGSQRRKGKMGQVMRRALCDMERRGIPFTFLQPANPAYYSGQGFVFFPYQKSGMGEETHAAGDSAAGNLRAASSGYSVHRYSGAAAVLEPAAYSGRDSAVLEPAAYSGRDSAVLEMAAFSNRILEQRYGIYIRRDAEYYRRLLAELRTEHGGALLLKDGGRICGILLYSIGGREGGKTAEIKELLLEHEACGENAEDLCREMLDRAGVLADEIKFTSSRMMVRITSLTALVPLLGSRRRLSLAVDVKDSVIAANNGCFQIEIGRKGGSIKGIAESLAERQMDIAGLAELLFGEVPVYLNEWV